MRVALQKLPGVESVNVSLERASADVRLRAGNTVTLPQLRTIVKNNGFTPKDATVTAIGKIVERGGGPALEITGINTVLILAADPKGPAAFNDARERLRRANAADVQVVGTVSPASADAPDRIAVKSIETVPVAQPRP